MIRLVSLLCLVFAGSAQTVDPKLAAEIANIKAFDNHAHPVSTEPKDNGFDALPVDNLEASSDFVRMRPDNPEIADAWRGVFGTANPEVIAQRRAEAKKEHGDGYPAWVLDQAGIETMLANRVSMGPGIVTPRFRWVSYVDALLFPLDNSRLAQVNPDRKQFFPLEEKLLRRYLAAVGLKRPPATLDDYLKKVVTATLEMQKRDGAVAVKFEAAYLRALDFSNPAKPDAQRVYASRAAPTTANYEVLQDYIFRYIATECGRLGLAVHLHTSAGGGSYFDVDGIHPLLMQPLFNDPALRKTRFVLVHGGWPFVHEVTALLTKPNVYADFSAQSFTEYPRALAATLREWMEHVPEKILFGTDAYPYSDAMGWEEMAWMTSRVARQALGVALTGMLEDNEIDRARAIELAKMVLHDNAAKLYQ